MMSVVFRFSFSISQVRQNFVMLLIVGVFVVIDLQHNSEAFVTYPRVRHTSYDPFLSSTQHVDMLVIYATYLCSRLAR